MIMSFFSHWFLWQAAGDLAIDEHGHIKLLCSWLVQGILNGLTPALFQQFLVPLESLGVEQFGHGLQFPFRKSAERAMGSQWDHWGDCRAYCKIRIGVCTGTSARFPQPKFIKFATSQSLSCRLLRGLEQIIYSYLQKSYQKVLKGSWLIITCIFFMFLRRNQKKATTIMSMYSAIYVYNFT